MAIKQRCPKCNQLNDPNAAWCVACQAPLKQTCPVCGTERPWYVDRCPRCEAQAADSTLFTELFRDEPTRRLHDRYQLKETVAKGRVTAVYRATDTAPREDPSADDAVAIKEFSTIALFRPDERREAEAALRRQVDRWAQVSHPSLVGIRETFAASENLYVVFEFIHGWTLGQILRGQGRATPDLVRNWGAQLCDLLIALHRQDPPLHVPFLSPDHVMIERDGRIKLVGLGLGHLFQPNAARPFSTARGYTAPELQSGFPDARSDILGLGRLLYAMLIDRPLELGLPRGLPLTKAVPGISMQLARAVARAAHRDPARRFPSAADLLEVLWDARAYGPLEPIETWRDDLAFEGPAPSEEGVAPRPTSRARRRPSTSAGRSAEAPAESMAAAGFVRDPRFGPREAAAPSRPGKPPSPMPAEPAGHPALSVYPRHLHVADLAPQETKRVVLTVRNSGDADLVGRVVSQVEWISAPKKTMRLPAQKQAKVILSVRGPEVPSDRAVEAQGILVDTNAGREWVAVTAELLTAPALQVEPTELDFGELEHDGPQAAALTVRNVGRQPLSGRVQAQVPWLRVPGGDIALRGNASETVRVELLPDRLPNGPQQQEALRVESDGGQARIMVKAWRRRPRLDLGTRHMDFGAVACGPIAPGVEAEVSEANSSSERFIYMHNAGDGPLEGTARSLLPWLQVHPTHFACSPGGTVQLTLVADCSGLAEGLVEIPQALRVQTNGGSETLSLRMEVLAPRLVLETEALEFGSVPLGEVRDLPLLLRNDGSLVVQVTVQSLVDWLAVSQQEVVVEPGQRASVRVQLRADQFTTGQHIHSDTAIRLVAGSELEQIPASITLLQPALQVDPDVVDFGYVDPAVPEQRTLTIRNEGTGRLAWNTQADAEWLEWNPQMGVCAAGEAVDINLTAYGLAIDQAQGSAEATLIVNSDGGRHKVPLRISLAAPLIATDTTYLDLGVSRNLEDVGRSFRIFNHGLGLLRGSLIADETWIVLDRASFECGTGRSVEVRVSTDMEELSGVGDVVQGLETAGTITIMSNSSDGLTVQVQVGVQVMLQPELALPEAVELSSDQPGAPPSGRLVLKNVGLATAHVQLRAPAPHIILARDVVDIKPHKSVRIRVETQADAAADTDGVWIEVRSGEETWHTPVRVMPSTG